MNCSGERNNEKKNQRRKSFVVGMVKIGRVVFNLQKVAGESPVKRWEKKRHSSSCRSWKHNHEKNVGDDGTLEFGGTCAGSKNANGTYNEHKRVEKQTKGGEGYIVKTGLWGRIFTWLNNSKNNEGACHH